MSESDHAAISASGPHAKLLMALQAVIFHSSGDITFETACAAAEAVAELMDEEALENWGVSATFKVEGEAVDATGADVVVEQDAVFSHYDYSGMVPRPVSKQRHRVPGGQWSEWYVMDSEDRLPDAT